MYIHGYSCISYQKSFRNPGYSEKLEILSKDASWVQPEYQDRIPVMDRRRMTDIYKMATTTALDALNASHTQNPDAIIIGTAFGASQHSKNFLKKIAESHNSLLAPTSFIVSTHNSIAGQLSLRLKNHGYNMTHTQNSLSFEHALIDAQICLQNRNMNRVLVGGCDEKETDLYNQELRIPHKPITSGAAFFVVSNDKSTIQIVDIHCSSLIHDINPLLEHFLEQNQINASEIDLIAYATKNPVNYEKIRAHFKDSKTLDYLDYTGAFLTAAAAALDIVIDKLTLSPNGYKYALIVNNLIDNNLGLTLLCKN